MKDEKDKNSYVLVRDCLKTSKLMSEICLKIGESKLTTIEVLGILEFIKLNVYFYVDNSSDKIMIEALNEVEK